MAYTLADVEKLEAAISSGTMRVTYADRTIQYQDITAMRAARREMLAEIDAASGAPSRKRTIRITQTGKGY